ncbi:MULTISPECIES: SAM-dependent methyltransferase [Actinomadura]|uniref:SAM-dependent methyltransferase n=1 Tax=Actinomadura litoris TaxID=2678616 RepID=A0A7K1L4K5_9ACTN|nr:MULTISPECIES: SAM-dependent methyltransferase [Actinomadura]MBT2210000.1 SAM-dependent methyltransferase [Actinomadura sp. NEAU-AAG7]MUN39175.1 SAM-dependent methyltransferase [Actinomadura litoris]
MSDHGPEIDTSVSHVARIWNYWLGGKDNYPVDREVGDQILELLPDVARLARASRLFLNRAVWHMAREVGIRQFIDIGTGLPTVDNTHEVAQRAAPESRIVYVDNDPLVLAHAQALLTSTPEGATAYIDADLREPELILSGAAATLDFTRPIGLTLMGILEFITDDDEAQSIVRRLLAALPSGSHFAMYDGTNVIHGAASDRIVELWNAEGNAGLVLRSPERIRRFFDGLELLEPGVVSVTRWRPEVTVGEPPEEVDAFCGMGRKP